MYKFCQTRAFCQIRQTRAFGTLMTGKEFNAKHKKTSYKFLYDNLKHYGMTYKQGPNEDHIPFNPAGKCQKGGLYFTQNPADWLNEFGPKMAYVSVPGNAKVYNESNKFKANKFILSEIINIEDMKEWNDFDFCLEMVEQNGYYLKYVKNQTDKICLKAVQQTGRALQYVKNQTDEICLEAVKQDGDALQYVKNQTKEICLKAVRKDGCALRYVKNQTDEICLKAVLQDGYALDHVKNKTDEICLAAVRRRGWHRNML